ncbi:polysaccharide deacetylase family protein [Enterovirga aerilata]|uniref:Chitooligosaccharide deacetylase n=1 Tax=Enterovirga aerilata TaxID=2730920 RepID=A0A849I4K8_9HYPH|nr:polysaccharide deacetylase family protein [Enterovirga sp. DB1703]NNM72261.1 polysaccharide deacetylase family protein [Enterovirga sp. DB1703]
MDTGLKHRVIGAGFRAIAAVRADRWLAPMARGCGVILTFHHVRPAREDAFQPNALLSITPEHLDLTLRLVRDSGFEIVSLDDVPERLRAGREAQPFCALTFDDGYRDNREHALPVLRRHGAPWTLFVTSDYASGHGRLWWLELEEVVRRRPSLMLDGRELPARGPEEKQAAFAHAYAVLRAGPEQVLRDTIAAWCAESGVDMTELVRRECMGWDELAELARQPGVAIGAHTLSHPMLAKHDAGRAWLEIEGGRAAIAEKLGAEPRHLSYPVGDPGSAGPREFELAARAGYATAVTTRPGHVFPEHAAHLTALPRVSVNGLHQSEAAVRALLSGVPFLAWNRGRRLDVA